MVKKFWVLLTAFAVCGVSLTGCGPKRPADMPETVPFKVTVVDGSTPIADVDVFFINTNGNAVITGRTNAQGVAEMQTSLLDYTEKGAPAGEYRVTCTKDPQVEHWKTPQERALMDPGEAGAYQLEWQKKNDELPREIPIVWREFDKSPLKTTVPAGGGDVTFDVEGHANDKPRK